MENNQEFSVKIKNFTWKNYKLIIREKDFQLIKQNSLKQKILTYSLVNATILDKSDKVDQKILLSSHIYNFLIKITKFEDKKIIVSKIEEIIKKYSEKRALGNEYIGHLQKISEHIEKSHYDTLIFKLETYKILIDEINIQLLKYKSLIKEKLNNNLVAEFLSIHNNINTISIEMKNQFKKIERGIKKYFKINNDNIIIENENESSSSSSSENNLNIIKKRNSQNYYFLKTELLDFYNPNYDFRERVKLHKNIKCPDNMIKEMIAIFNKKIPAPIYFYEPLSMGQKQCEKFFYLDMLTKASKYTNDKPLQMCYISAFIVGEIFLNIGRFLKPFNPLLGETYEYYENSHKFRYYSEQVKHKPQITAFIGETPEFSYYGDTLADSSFKSSKGIELIYKNKINIYIKTSESHYIFNRPIVFIKGFMKPPLYNEYTGTTIIEDKYDKNYKCELTFFEQGLSSNELGKFEGKAYDKKNIIKYLIGGNWQEEIYITDPDGNNKQILLSLNKNSTYLTNSMEKYTLPHYSCNLNYYNDTLKNSLPRNDSRFRKDIRLLEKGETHIRKAQIYKNAYEEKQRKEIKDEEHKILFFNEYTDEETGINYYIPNGEYWKLKKNGQLINNKYKDIFDVDKNYLKVEEEREKQREKEEKERKEIEENIINKEEENKIIEENGNYIIKEEEKEEKEELVGKAKLKERIKEKEEKEKREGKKNIKGKTEKK